MKKAMVFVLIMGWMALFGCSMPAMQNQNGVDAVFDGIPRIFDSTVVYMGRPVGQVVASQWNNGVTQLTISLDGQHVDLRKTNLAAVVKRGRLHLDAMGTSGAPLPEGACINGFVNMASYRWFKFKHIINNINISAERRAQRLKVRSSLAG
jgi:hypothetical protein